MNACDYSKLIGNLLTPSKSEIYPEKEMGFKFVTNGRTGKFENRPIHGPSLKNRQRLSQL
jgi:hypothetical protein